jgi:Mitochondrial ribosomal protein (VAR1)
LFNRELNALTYILENHFNCSIQLEITRLKYPFYDSNILSQLIGLNGKKYGYEQVINKLFPYIKIRNPNTILTHYDLSPKRKKSLVSYISGIKLRIAGRFFRHKIVPKRTVSTYQKGSLQRGVVNFVECSKYINKSKRGSFCISISLSHIF